MEMKEQASVELVVDVICDACQCSTRVPGYGLQYGKLEAQWGYGSKHDGEHYLVHLCEPCFFSLLGGLRRGRMLSTMFDDDNDDPHEYEELGLISEGNIWEKS